MIVRGVSRGVVKSVAYSPLGHVQTGVNLFAAVMALAPTVVFDPSNLATLFQDRLGASSVIPAVVDGPVGTMLDLSGGAHHAIAPLDAARPLLRTGNGLWWLEFSGPGSNRLFHGMVAGVAVAVAMRPLVAPPAAFLGIFATSGGAGVGSMILASTASTKWGTFGTVEDASNTTLVNGTDYILCMPSAAAGNFRRNGANDGSYPSTSGQATAHIGGDPTQYLSMRFYGLAGRTADLSASDERTFENWLSAKSGVALP